MLKRFYRIPSGGMGGIEHNHAVLKKPLLKREVVRDEYLSLSCESK